MADLQVGPQGSLSLVTDPSEELARRSHEEGTEAARESGGEVGSSRGIAFLPHTMYLCDLRHDAWEASTSSGPAENGVVSKWRMKDRMKTGCVALVLCLNIGVDPPDVIKISPCARLECWIDPFSMSPQKALEAIGKSLQTHYERWQPRARYKLQLDPTVEEVKKLCSQCRKSAKSERVLFHYNGHGVPRPTINGEIWFFNKSYTQYIPLSVYELDSWLESPSIYVFDCSGAGMIVNALCERSEWLAGSSGATSKDCILLAACGSSEILPQNAELPADVFTSCLTTPIKIALRWSLLRDSLKPECVDNIPGRQNDRKTPLGELNWIFTAITDTIAWNVLPRELFQRLFRQDLLVASLFRNFLLAERVMRSANCSPQSYPRLPLTHQHPMWHAWDMAAEICLSQIPSLLQDPAAEFQPSPFFSQQLSAFEVWLEHGSERKKPPEQLPIVLQVLLSQSHRFRALVLLGRFLDMGAWAVDLALSVGIFPYVLKLLQTTATELRQILVFIWTKILALDKSCQVDLVKDGGHHYFIRFLDSPDVYPEQQAMAAFVLAVIMDGHSRGQAACFQAGLIGICLNHIQAASITEAQAEPLLLQWLCLCLGKLWDGLAEAQNTAFQENAPAILAQLLVEPQPEVRASATYALGTLLSSGSELTDDSNTSEDDEEEDKLKYEQGIARSLLKVVSDGSPLVRAELAIALSRLTISHCRHLHSAAAAYLKPPSSPAIATLQTLGSTRSPSGSLTGPSQILFGGKPQNLEQGKLPIRAIEGSSQGRRMVTSNSPVGSPGHMPTPPSSGASSPLDDSKLLENGSINNGLAKSKRARAEDSGVYVQCVAAAYALVRDPSPRVANLGKIILRRIGVESYVMQSGRPTTKPGHNRNSSVPSFQLNHQTGGLTRSASWVETNLGNPGVAFRTSASPPARPTYLSCSPVGMRRVPSLEFSSSMATSQNPSRLQLRISGEIGNGVSSSLLKPSSATGLAEAGSMLSGAVTHVAVEVGLPESMLYSWSCGHFSRPLLEPALDDEDEILVRREERERMALDGISKGQHLNVSKVSDQIASWDTQSDMGTKAVLLHPFLPIVCIADDKETIRIWNYEDATVVNAFDNNTSPEKGVSKLCLLNDFDDSLLLVATNDGNVRVWKDYTQKDKQRLATAWQTIHGHRPGARGVGAVVDWQQLTGYLYASGEISSVMVWDLDRELLASSISSQAESCVSAISASQVHGGLLTAGFADGSVRIFDVRTHDALACSTKPHSQRVMGIDFQPGMDTGKIVSASQAGDIKFLDIRNSSSPYHTVEAHKGHLTALAVHRYAPVIASGSAKQYIKVFSASGEQLSMIRYHNSFLGQRIGPVSCLSFHPYNVLLAAGASDSVVSIYAGESSHTS
ncbi:hypothetical protein O6H91_04G107500 [Diphasiastrum complanatum]|uniref:Uncharacterized protein n=1 Tax=Diphasiastrum complanatum TaxID=34168 RepID=A0ACC2E0R4_DIPCM|nr:hypothetical protein O6H91_04G107500 [Diphasiastrum complanatum]